jgi:WD40 repeat protein
MAEPPVNSDMVPQRGEEREGGDFSVQRAEDREPDGVAERPTNPYVGPRPFEAEEEEYFFGRRDETRQLADLVIAQRVVVFHAPSGAGKTSLLKASLIPTLNRRKRIVTLPISRVSGDLPPDVPDTAVDNIYVFNVLVGLYGSEARAAELAGLSLQAGITPLLAPKEGENRPRPRLLIIDQFEELFTTHLERHPERGDFFRQLQHCLAAHPQLSLLLAMREDYIANLDFYAAQIPDRLRTRFRIERLSERDALEAVKGPAARAGRPFDTGVAEALVDNLRRIQLGQFDVDMPRVTVALGSYIEPVHLQIVCRQLWEKLPPDRTLIVAEDVQRFGDVDQALTGYYEDALRQVVEQTGISERRLRAWFNEQLITPARTRGLVYRGAGASAGLDNEAVAILNNVYIIRADVRGSDTWYELAHDRLVEPILATNAAWLVAYFNPLAAPTQRWLQTGRDPAQLLRSPLLDDAAAFAQANRTDLLPAEQEFLDESLRTAAAETAQARQAAQRRRALAVAALAVIALLAALSLWALRNAELAWEQQRIAKSRELAALAQTHLDTQLDLALLLALEANRVGETIEARGALFTALQSTPQLVTYLHGHSGSVWSVAYHPQGELLASGGEDGLVYLWNPTSTDAPITLPVGDAPDERARAAIEALVFDPTGAYLVAGRRNGALSFWQLHGNSPVVTTIPAREAQVNSLAFHPDGHLLYSAGRDGVAVTELTSLSLTMTTTLIDTQATSDIAVSPNGRWLVLAHDDGLVALRDLNDNQETVLSSTDARYPSVAFSPDSRTLAVGSIQPLIHLWRLSDRQVITLTGHTDWVESLAFSPNGEILVSASRDRTVRRWDVASGRPAEPVLAKHRDWVNDVAFHPDGQHFASASADGMVIIWNAAVTPRLGHPLRSRNHPGHTDEVWSVAFSPDGRWIASGGQPHELILWRVDEDWAFSLAEHDGPVRSVAFSPDSALLASGDEHGAIRLWQVGAPDIAPAHLLHREDTMIGSLAFHPTEPLLASGGFDGNILLWDLRATLPVSSLLGIHDGEVWSVTFSSDGKKLLAGDDSGVAKMWDMTTQTEDRILRYDSPLRSTALSADTPYIAGGSIDRLVILWNGQTGEREALLGRHQDGVQSVAFSPDSQILVSGGMDGAAILWDLRTRRIIGAQLNAHGGRPVNGVAFSPDGRTLATAGDDRLVMLWDLDPASWRERACRIANRRLSQEEWQLYLGNEEVKETCAAGASLR